MARLTEVFRTPHIRMKAVTITLVIIVLASVLFVIYENRNNRIQYLNMYREKQTEYVRQLGNELDYLVPLGLTDAELTSYFGDNAEVSGNSWMFLCRGEEVVFAKDQTTTDSLREAKDKEIFLEQIKEQDVIFISLVKQINGTSYLVGTVTDEYHALTRGNVIQHEIYIYLVMGVFVMLATMAIMAGTAKLNRVEKELEKTYDTLRRQNIKLEKSEDCISTEPDSGDIISMEQRESQEIYDAGLIQMFLKKSNDAALMPMQILFTNIVMESRYYSRQEIFDVLEKLKKFLKPSHITGEIMKGRFVVLMYRTDYEEAVCIMNRFREYYEANRTDHSIQFDMYVMEVKEGRTAMDVYAEGLKRGKLHE